MYNLLRIEFVTYRKKGLEVRSSALLNAEKMYVLRTLEKTKGSTQLSPMQIFGFVQLAFPFLFSLLLYFFYMIPLKKAVVYIWRTSWQRARIGVLLICGEVLSCPKNLSC